MKEFINSFLLLFGRSYSTSGDIGNPYNMETEDDFNILLEDNYFLLNEG